MRFASGLPHGTYFGVAALVAATLSPPNQRARAVGLVMLGLTVAILAGAPLATWLGQRFGWRAAFVFVGAVALLAAVLIRREVPDMPADADASPGRELGALARPQVWMTLATAGIGFGGLFCVFSYSIAGAALIFTSGSKGDWPRVRQTRLREFSQTNPMPAWPIERKSQAPFPTRSPAASFVIATGIRIDDGIVAR